MKQFIEEYNKKYTISKLNEKYIHAREFLARDFYLLVFKAPFKFTWTFRATYIRRIFWLNNKRKGKRNSYVAYKQRYTKISMEVGRKTLLSRHF